MRFRRIEKSGGMANVGLPNQHMQGKEDDVTTSDSKTYIGSNSKKRVAMNKIKNTRVGDDIHYYINGKEGRGIVVKMANEYLEVFKENGQLGTIHINDTFFVKDILVNKQWDDMDDGERYEALTKIHAPSPRYITKQWSDMPEEIKVLLTKEGGNMAGGTGSTNEQGESKESETKDHARTGFAQNTQYAKKGLCEVHKMADCPHCGKDIPSYKGPAQKKARWVDPRTGAEDWTEHSYRYDRDVKTEAMKKTHLPSEHIGHPDYFNKEKNPMWNKRKETDPDKLDKTGNRYGKGHHTTHHPDDPVSERNKKRGYSQNYSKAGKEAEYRAKRRNSYNIHEKEAKEAEDEAKYQEYKKYRDADKKKNPRQDVAPNQESEYQKQIREAWGQTHPDEKEEPKKESPPPKKESGPTGGFVTEDDYDNDTKKAYEIWLERREEWRDKAEAVPKDDPRSKLNFYEMFDVDMPGETEKERGDNAEERLKLTPNQRKTWDKDRSDSKWGKKTKPTPTGKSDVEHGVYGNAGNSIEAGVSTDTKYDIPENTGYEERPHISVEEAGKLPRTTFNESGSELTVSGSQDSKDKPKFSQPADQEQPVRKAGIPQQHPNTYGMRYGMKGGVKKVWCPEHQVWEETTKDWHE